MKGDAEHVRLEEAEEGVARWRWWGPYVSARQWGTVREDYSGDGDAWKSFPFDHARSRAYRWGEDGLAAICDRWQHVCFGLALWNGNDPFLKDRLFGLGNEEGNHGEDVKEYWWALDSTPTHSWMRWLYKYPQAEFPYERLHAENAWRSRLDPEFELLDTGVFEDDRYFDVDVTYAKASPDDICIRIDAANRAAENAATLHVLPTIWFRNTWAWGRDDRHPALHAYLEGAGPVAVRADHELVGTRYLVCHGEPELLFCENESNSERLWGVPNETPYPKDGVDDHVVSGRRAATVNPMHTGTKASAWYQFEIPPGGVASVQLRLTPDPPSAHSFDTEYEAVFADRRAEADEFFRQLAPGVPAEAKRVQRLAVAGLLWAKKHYRYDVRQWLEGDPAYPPPPPGHRHVRNFHWTHLYNADTISMPDEWEYPWYAAWDLAFHMVPMAVVDPDFAKQQLLLLCREWYMHPNGQLPAYEWAFDDVNPPVHAWATWRVYKIAAQQQFNDYDFLERVFQKLLINFSWWVNRKDLSGNNVFEGGFLGLDNIGLFDRSRPLPGGTRLEQSDATSWMAMFCLNMLAIAMELAIHDRTYEDVCTKFFEHFLGIATAATHRDGLSLWDYEDGFFYDVLVTDDGTRVPLKVRSWVGLIPLFAVETREEHVLNMLPEFAQRMDWFLRKRPEQARNMHAVDVPGMGRRALVALVGPNKLRRILARVLDEHEFLSPYGLRSVSKVHEAEPVRLELDGEVHEVRYTPGESDTGLFGGNSNWRGPIWFPLNFLMIESLQKYHHYLGDDFTVEFPTGSGRLFTLWEVATELSHRLTSLFLPDANGRRPVNGGNDVLDLDPHWRNQVTFAEYFHGDTGAGLGATHQTGWTALVAKLIRQSGA